MGQTSRAHTHNTHGRISLSSCMVKLSLTFWAYVLHKYEHILAMKAECCKIKTIVSSNVHDLLPTRTKATVEEQASVSGLIHKWDTKSIPRCQSSIYEARHACLICQSRKARRRPNASYCIYFFIWRDGRATGVWTRWWKPSRADENYLL
jgi:hypothetical protein